MRRYLIAAAALVAAAVASPYFTPSFPLPKTEGFEYSVVPLIYLANGWLEGVWPYWNFHAALGIPWPVPHGMSYTPFTPFFAVFPPLTTVGLIVFAHLFLMGIFVIRTCDWLGVNKAATCGCLITLQLSPALEYLFWSDAPGVFLTWCMLPVQFYYLNVLLFDDRPSEVLTASLLLGLATGYTILNGHTGVIPTYALGFLFFCLASVTQVKMKLGPLLLATIVALLVGADKITFLLNELSYFSPQAPRSQQVLFGGMEHLLWNTFLKPLFWPTTSPTSVHAYLAEYVSEKSTIRTYGLGLVVTLLVLWGMVPGVLKTQPSKGLKIGLLAGFAFLTMPISYLPAAISATWTIRDVMHLLSALLAALVLNRYWDKHRIWPRVFVLSQVTLAILTAWPEIMGPLSLESRGRFSVQTYNDAVNPDRSSSYVALLTQTLGSAFESGSRYVATAEATRMMDIETLADVGAVNNFGFAHDLDEVGFVAKGISLDAIHPASLLPYGVITGQRFQHWSVTSGTEEWTLQNSGLVSLLSIGAVVAASHEEVANPSLVKTGVLAGRDGFELTVYRNNDRIKRALLIDDELANPTDSSNGKALTSRDVNAVVEFAKTHSTEFSVSLFNNRMTVDLQAPASFNNLLITSMYRPEWRAWDNEHRALPISSWSGLLLIHLRKDTSSVELHYQPTHQIIARWTTILSTAVVVILLGTLGVAGHKRRPTFTRATSC